MSRYSRFLKSDARVALTSVTDDVDVSTVLLPNGVYETCVFGGPLDQKTRRYTTEGDARDGHRLSP